MHNKPAQLILSAAAFVAALALFAFAIGGTPAYASGSAGQSGRYQLSGDEYVYRVIDTTNGDIYIAHAGEGFQWEPLEHQLSGRVH